MVLDHHAYLFIGARGTALGQIEKIIAAHGPAEVFRREREVWRIEDSRQVSESQRFKGWSGQRKFFVIVADLITVPAQQALLKVLEEPAPQTYFMIASRAADDLLPTVRSRCQTFDLTTRVADQIAPADQTGDQRWAKNFLAARPDRRLALIAELPLTADEKIDRRRAAALAAALELVCHQQLLVKPTPELAEALRALSQARDYLADQSSLPKLIFEHLALVLPILGKFYDIM